MKRSVDIGSDIGWHLDLPQEELLTLVMGTRLHVVKVGSKTGTRQTGIGCHPIRELVAQVDES
jgi:hypothetical protein